MEDIKKEKNFHMYFMVSIVLAMFMEIYAFLMRLNLLNIFIFISFIFYLWNQNHKKKQVNYLIQCCDAIIEQKDFSIIDGESKESLLSNKLYVLNKRYHQSLKAVKKEQLKLKDYIEDISHQLKTPITSIRIQTELLLEENQNKKLYSIEHQIQRIQLLVNDLQTIALLDSHNIQYCFKEYDLQTLIDEIEEDLDYLNPQIHLNKNIKVLCDEKWFIEALENIIKNCLEKNSTPLSIFAYENETTLKMMIQDQGNGFKKKEDAQKLICELSTQQPLICTVEKIERKKENKNPPLLFNLAELQNVCSKLFKISPDETLRIVQELYEKKLVTYPRTDARVLSTAVSKEITKNLNGLSKYQMAAPYMQDILHYGAYKNLAKTRYVNDKQITDHYAIIPTGQGLSALNSVSATAHHVYDVIVRRFLSIFYPPAVYQKVALVTEIGGEQFFSNFRVLAEEGYLKVAGVPAPKKNANGNDAEGDGSDNNVDLDAVFFASIQKLKKGDILDVKSLDIKEGETSPPKRYNSGSMILAMENAGQLIEDEELRAQIKGSGIGTSATRAEILKKLFNIKYLALNKKTQVITPTLLGEMIYDVVLNSIRSLLNPELTASWEKGLNYVAEGEITSDEYMTKLDHFIVSRTNGVLGLNNQYQLRSCYDRAAAFYKKETKGRASKGKKE